MGFRFPLVLLVFLAACTESTYKTPVREIASDSDEESLLDESESSDESEYTEEETESAISTEVAFRVQLGSVLGATVEAYIMDYSTGGASGTSVGSCITDEYGECTTSLSEDYLGEPLVFKASGGSYTDEATGLTVSNDSGVLYAVASDPSSVSVIPIDFVSNVLANRVQSLVTTNASSAELIAEDITTLEQFAEVEVAEVFGLSDVYAIPALDSDGDAASTDSNFRALLNAAVSTYASTLSTSAVNVIDSLSLDFKDGLFDGINADMTEITYQKTDATSATLATDAFSSGFVGSLFVYLNSTNGLARSLIATIKDDASNLIVLHSFSETQASTNGYDSETDVTAARLGLALKLNYISGSSFNAVVSSGVCLPANSNGRALKVTMTYGTTLGFSIPETVLVKLYSSSADCTNDASTLYSFQLTDVLEFQAATDVSTIDAVKRTYSSADVTFTSTTSVGCATFSAGVETSFLGITATCTSFPSLNGNLTNPMPSASTPEYSYLGIDISGGTLCTPPTFLSTFGTSTVSGLPADPASTCAVTLTK